MTETLERALAPLMTIGSFCDFGMFEHPLGQPRPYLSCLYVLAKWSFLTYSVYYPSYIYDLKNNVIYLRTYKPLITITLVLISFCRFKELKMCLRELAIVDDTLEALGMPKEYQRLRNWIIRMIIGWILFIFTDLAQYNLFRIILDSKFTISNSFYETYFTFIYHYPMFINIINVLISGIILGYTSSRFHRVNDLLHTLDSDLFESSADSRRQNRSILVHQRITGSKGYNQHIWIIMYYNNYLIESLCTHMHTHVGIYVYRMSQSNFHIDIFQKVLKKCFLWKCNCIKRGQL
ncbi:hypothetical protein ALC60_13228 [Trachymyrmex zeteki]|uniref:Gustatory receptor n=1 Tax=Mycetomoellerius zeteki TaxID=64791 RepID=A0A151WIV2_9HYME|nr:hypothetical protein ALC60_13228 [Trachymyrmex zeteki]